MYLLQNMCRCYRYKCLLACCVGVCFIQTLPIAQGVPKAIRNAGWPALSDVVLR